MLAAIDSIPNSKDDKTLRTIFLFLYAKVGLLGLYLLQHLGFFCIREGRTRCSGFISYTRFTRLTGITGVAHRQVVGYTLYLQFGRCGCMGARELYLCFDVDLTRRIGAAYKYRC